MTATAEPLDPDERRTVPTVSPTEAGEVDANASRASHTRARELETVPDSRTPAVRESRSPGVVRRTAGAVAERAKARATDPAWWVELVRPPEVWTAKRPALRDVARYAWHGAWTSTEDTSALRHVGRAYAVLVALPAHLAGYVALWLLERPARALVLVALLGAAVLTPPGATVVHWVASIAATVAGAVADLTA